MRITCPTCAQDFVLPDEQIDHRGAHSSCPNCHTDFEVTIDDQGSPQISFQKDRLTEQRICIQCSKAFIPEELDVIPICPACKGIRKAPEKPQGAWRLKKGGREIELATAEVVRDWIRQGAILPDDELVSPAKLVHAAKQYKDFSQEFRAQKKLSKVVTNPSFFSSRRYFHLNYWTPKLILISVIGIVGWSLFRIVTFSPSGPQYNRDLSKFADSLSARVEPSHLETNALVAQALKLMAQDRPESYEEAAVLLEQGVAANPVDPVQLGLLAEAYAIAFGTTEETRYRQIAISLADLSLRLFPKEIQSYVAKIRASLASGDVAQARATLEKAIPLNPTAPRLLLARSALLLSLPQNQFSLDDLLQSTRAALSQDNSLLEAYDLMGLANSKLLKPIEARQAFEERIKVAPEDPKAPFRLGQLEERARHLSRAREWYESALRLNPNMVEARLRIGILLSKNVNELKEAERHFNEIVTRYRRFASTEQIFFSGLHLSLLLADLKRGQEAMDQIQRFPLEFANTFWAMAGKSIVFEATGRTNEALNIVKEYASSHPGEFESLIRAGELLISSGATEEGIRNLREAQKSDLRNLRGYLTLLNAFVDLDRLPDALDAASLALGRSWVIDENDAYKPYTHPFNHDLWGKWILAEQKLVRRFKDEANSHAFLGLTQLAQGIKTDDAELLKIAKRNFETSIKLRNTESANTYLGVCHLYLKDYKEAEKTFRHVLVMNPANVAGKFHLAISQMNEDRLDSAQKIFSELLTDLEWKPYALLFLGNIEAKRKNLPKAKEFWTSSLQSKPDFIPPWEALLSLRS